MSDSDEEEAKKAPSDGAKTTMNDLFDDEDDDSSSSDEEESSDQKKNKNAVKDKEATSEGGDGDREGDGEGDGDGDGDGRGIGDDDGRGIGDGDGDGDASGNNDQDRATVTTTTQKTSEEDDDEDDDDEQKKKKMKREKNDSDTSGDDEDEDDDEEDAEFDESKAHITGRKASQRPSRTDNDDDEEDDGGGNIDVSKLSREERARLVAEGVSTSSTGIVQRPPRPPKTFNIPRVERPFPDALGENKGPTLHMTKLPNILGINAEPFDARTHDFEEEEEMYGTLMGNMIRWRYLRDKKSGEFVRDENGRLKRESNARIVKWSDGSLSLYIGEEMFDIDDMGGGAKANDKDNKDVANSGTLGNWGYLYMSQRAQQIPNEEEDEDADADVPDNSPITVLECVGPVQSKLTAKPSSFQSTAHKNLTLAVKQRNLKKARIAEYVTMVDPEKEKEERIAYKNDLMKNEQGKSRGGGYRPAGRRMRPGGHRGFDDDDRNYDSVNVGNLKRKRRDEDPDEMLDYGESDGDEEDDDWSKKKTWKEQKSSSSSKKKKKKFGFGKGDTSSSEEEALFQEESEQEDDEAPFVAKARARKRAAVLDADDDD